MATRLDSAGGSMRKAPTRLWIVPGVLAVVVSSCSGTRGAHSSTCGNGHLEAGESCADGNTLWTWLYVGVVDVDGTAAGVATDAADNVIATGVELGGLWVRKLAP